MATVEAAVAGVVITGWLDGTTCWIGGITGVFLTGAAVAIEDGREGWAGNEV